MGPIEHSLRKARTLITPEENWTQGAMARMRGQSSTHPMNPEACQWCLLGAIGRVTRQDVQQPAVQLLHKTLNGSIAEFNDSNKHHVVIAALGLAISRAKALGV